MSLAAPRRHDDSVLRGLAMAHTGGHRRHDSVEPLSKMKSSPPSSPLKRELSVDDDWLNLALAKLQQDGKLLLARESKESLAASKYSDSTSSKKISHRLVRPRVKSRGQNRRPPRPSLAATHPAFYSKPAQHAVALKVEDPSSPQKSLPHAHPIPSVHVSGSADCPATPHWQRYVDPKGLAGYGDPALYDPTPRMLKIDTQAVQSIMVSPGFMIPLPCGGLVEMATFYGQQPRDPPTA